MRALSSPPFRNYQIWWSLSDSKYAGTALLVKKCFQPKKVSFSLGNTGILVFSLSHCYACVMKNSNRFCSCNVKLIACLVPIT